IEMLSYSIGPQLGQFRSGFFANLFGLRAALITGGIACSVGALAVGKGMKELWNYDDRTNIYAIAERKNRSTNLDEK
ncbi:MAG: hypothetical protein RL038_1184, partial [Actinomycetota bacterium]